VKLLDRYIRRSVLLNVSIVLAVLLILFAFFTLLEELQDVGKGNYQTTDALKFILFSLPGSLYDIFPAAVLIGSLIGMGELAGNSELIAIRASGVPIARIVMSVLKAGLLGVVVVLFIGEFIAPGTSQYGERFRAEKISEKVTLKTRYGFWARDGDAFINIRQVLPGAELRDIYIYEYEKDRKLKQATYAARAEYRGDHWLLHDLQQSRFSEARVESETFRQASWESIIDPELLDLVVVKPSLLSVWDLVSYIGFLRSSDQESTLYEVAFWNKMINPFVTLIMVFLSVPVVFGVLRSVGIGQRIFAGLILGLLFFLLNKAFGHMAVVYQLNPLFSALFPALLFLGLGLWLTRRIA
jgi:lipopolysaccharide export system permease protein